MAPYTWMDRADDQNPKGPDDTEDFHVSAHQRRIHDLAHTRRQMEKVYNSIWGPRGSLSEYAARLEREGLYVRVRRR